MSDAVKRKKIKKIKESDWPVDNFEDNWDDSKTKSKKIKYSTDDTEEAANLGIKGRDAAEFVNSNVIVIENMGKNKKDKTLNDPDDDSIDLSKIDTKRAEIEQMSFGDFGFDPTWGGEYMKADKHGLSKHHRRAHQITWVHKEAESKASQVEKELKEQRLKKVATRQKYGW